MLSGVSRIKLPKLSELLLTSKPTINKKASSIFILMMMSANGIF
jgi:hypothetical protein